MVTSVSRKIHELYELKSVKVLADCDSDMPFVCVCVCVCIVSRLQAGRQTNRGSFLDRG